MSVERFNYDICYDYDNGRYEVEEIKCDNGAMVTFDDYNNQTLKLDQLASECECKRIHMDEQDRQIEQANNLIETLKDRLIYAAKTFDMLDDHIHAAPCKPAATACRELLSNTKGA